jgi:hypothetical protein
MGAVRCGWTKSKAILEGGRSDSDSDMAASSLSLAVLSSPVDYTAASYLHGEDDDGTRFEKKKKEPKEGGGGGGGAAEEGGEAKPKKKRSKPRSSAPTQKLDEVCNNYLEGRCRYGDECRRIHEGDVEQKVTREDFFLQRGRQRTRTRLATRVARAGRAARAARHSLLSRTARQEASQEVATFRITPAHY